MDTLRTELKYAARGLARTPVFTVVAVLSLALGIGVNTAVFSLINALLFRPLPYAHAERLVDVYEHHPVEVCAGCGIGSSYANYLALRTDARTLDGIAAYATEDFTMGTEQGAERRYGARVSATLFPLLGIDPLWGRVFGEVEDVPGGERVVLIGESLWRARFDGRPDAVGRSIRINGELHTIIGVMPEAMAFPAFAELWVPLAPTAAAGTRADRDVGIVARIAAGSTLDATAAEIAGLGAQSARAYPETNEGWALHVMPLRSDLASDYAGSFWLMLGIVSFVLLVACANLANLLMARASSRRQELTIRAALGASRAMLARHMLAESLLISTLAGAIGVLIATWSFELLAFLPERSLPAWVRYGVDIRVAAFAVGVALGTGLLFGLLPALQATRIDLQRVLQESARGTTTARSRTLVRNALVSLQVAAATVLVFGATFLTAEFLRIHNHVAGDEIDNLYGGSVTAAGPEYDDPRTVVALADALIERIATRGGVEHVALSSMFIPNWPGTPTATFRVEGRAAEEVAGLIHRVHNVTPDYFAANGIQIIAGRDFADGDRAGARPVGIIGRKLASELWPNANPLGKQLHLGGAGDDWITIVGVVPSGRPGPFARDTAMLLYLPLAQHAVVQPAPQPLSLHLRVASATGSLPQQVREAAAQVDADLVVENVRSARESHAASTAPVRMVAIVVSAFCVFAVLLACMGIYGLIAFTVAQRTPELGVRLALGATRAGVTRMVLRQALGLAGVGMLFGLLGAVSLTSVLRSQMTGAQSPPVMLSAGVTAGFLAMTVLASWVPARRAARIDPIAALRAD